MLPNIISRNVRDLTRCPVGPVVSTISPGKSAGPSLLHALSAKPRRNSACRPRPRAAAATSWRTTLQPRRTRVRFAPPSHDVVFKPSTGTGTAQNHSESIRNGTCDPRTARIGLQTTRFEITPTKHGPYNTIRRCTHNTILARFRGRRRTEEKTSVSRSPENPMRVACVAARSEKITAMRTARDDRAAMDPSESIPTRVRSADARMGNAVAAVTPLAAITHRNSRRA